MKRLAFVLAILLVLAGSLAPVFAGDDDWAWPSYRDDGSPGHGQWGSVPSPYKPWSMFGPLNPFTGQPKTRRDDPWTSAPRSRDADRYTMPDLNWPFREHKKDDR